MRKWQWLSGTNIIILFFLSILIFVSSYCGLAILHSLMYKKVADAQYRSKLSNELMMYHMKVGWDNFVDNDIDIQYLSIASRSCLYRGN